MERSLIKESVLGPAAAFAATKVMDRVTTAFQQGQSTESLEREKELLEEPAYVVAAKKMADARGEHLDQETAERIGSQLHIGLGLFGGLVAGVFAARGMNPLAAGILTGLGIWVVFDEGANAALGITPPVPEYPRETHLRGLVGHLAYGTALGAFLGLGNLIFRRRRREG
jgi:hypothetical protein